MAGSIENLVLEQPPTMYGKGNPYKSPVSMDSMIWQKRNVRRQNMKKDKEGY